MATIYQQNRWSQKPPSAISINRGSPQAKGLIAFWPVLNNDSNRLRNLVSPGDALSANGWKKGGGLYGPAALLNGSNQKFIANGRWPGGNVTYSLRVKLNAVATGTTQNNEFIERDSDGSTWGFQFQMAGPKLIFYIVNQTPAALSLTGTASLVTGVWYHLVASYNLSTTACRLYINGKLDNSGNLSATSIRGTGAQYTIGATEASTRFVNGYMDDIRVYDRALLDAEVMDIYQNPLSVFTNQSNIMYSSDSEVVAGYNASQFFMVM